MIISSKVKAEALVIKSFLTAITIGTALLTLPVASASNSWTNPLTALFTATSAVCVTGLNVVDIGTNFSFFGQLVILVLIQLGGLGIMLAGTFFLSAITRRLNLNEQIILMDALGTQHSYNIRKLLIRTVSIVFLIEAAGAVLLIFSTRNIFPADFRFSIWNAIFHSISAFCNAGFSLYSDSLTCYRNNFAVVLIFITLIILGGLGFPVIYNVFSMPFSFFSKFRYRLSLHSKMVLIATAVLLITGWILFMLLEWNNSLTVCTLKEKLLISLFHSVTPRTAGFSMISIQNAFPATQFIAIILMFIGGGSSSTAGGIKVTTFAVLLLAAWAMIKGKADVEFGKRALPEHVIREAIAIFVAGVLCVSLFAFALFIIEKPEQHEIMPLFFEVVSAFGTVGLSMDVTPNLSSGGKIIIMFLMFLGRVGPLTLAIAIGKKELSRNIRLAEEEVFVG